MHLRTVCCALILTFCLWPQSAAFAQGEEITKFYQEVVGAIAAQPRPTYPVEAQALITFTVADDGSIASAAVAQSSGSIPLDDTALQIVQNAAPFPPPPDGAKRDLSITIKATRPRLSFGN